MTTLELREEFARALTEQRRTNQHLQKLVVDYMNANPDQTLSLTAQATSANGNRNNDTIEHLVDEMIRTAAWIQDTLEGRTVNFSHKTYRGSLSKKVRRALGYTS